ncbi:MAG TPA: right-handed parallel beta-helix repeat-containing protein, partial [Vicinamibacteria bacterium]
GFRMRHAATPWAPPTAEQVGLLGTHWSRGWVIEGNTISHSISSGIALGKHGDRFDNTSADAAEGYVLTIERAHAHPIPWTKAAVGGHVVRDNHVSHCEQAGIVGSLGPAFSVVTGNTIHDIHVRALFGGAEMAGIKLHGAIDAVIEGNHVYRTVRGLWLDWMAQGTRVSRNLFHDSRREDLFLEVNHGPFVVDHNLLLSPTSLLDVSEGGAFAHNLFLGKIANAPEPGRETPFHPPHSTAVAGLLPTRGGGHRFHNNVFVGRGDAGVEVREGDWLRPQAGYGLQVYEGRPSLQSGGNVYLGGARPGRDEKGALVLPAVDPRVRLVEEKGSLLLRLAVPAEWPETPTAPVTTSSLGKAPVPQLPYENADGSPLVLDRDFLGHPRDPGRPTPGPFEGLGAGEAELKLR